jgi:hypothetical protein
MEDMTYDSDDIIDVQVQFAYLLLQGSDANLKSQTSNHLSHVSSGSSSSFGNSKLKLTKVNSNLFFVKQTVNSTIDTLQSVTKGRRQDDIKANSKQKKKKKGCTCDNGNCNKSRCHCLKGLRNLQKIYSP